MQISVKKVAKATGAVCAATGIVALSAVVASGAAAGAVVEGFKSAGGVMKKILSEEVEKKVLDDGQQCGNDAAEGIAGADNMTGIDAAMGNVAEADTAEDIS